METKVTEKPPANAGKCEISVRPQGGWITFPFVAGTMLGLGISFSGAISNMIVYLIKEFNTNRVDAAQIYNIILGCTTLAPVAGAIVSDAFFGCFPVVAFSTFVNFLSLVLFTLTATIPSLRASTAGFAVLYLAVALLSIGTGGTHFNMMTMGADQFDEAKDQETFINWYLITVYLSIIIGATVILYIQDNLSWGLGFGLCAAASAAAMVVLLVGSRYYRRPKAKGSPVTGLARVVVASIRKRKADRLGQGVEYYYGTGEREEFTQNPTHGFRFLNRAALISEGDKNTDGSVAKPWNLCSVEQVEDLKILLRILPLLTTAIFLNVDIGGQDSLTVLQALTVDRTIGRSFTIPAGSMNVSTQVTAAVFISFLDRILMPSFRKLTGRTLTPLQRVGLGHLLNILAMAASALVERRRAMIVHTHNATEQPGWIVPMSVLWLLLPNAVTGIGQAMHFPGFVSFLYQEFPKSFSSTATAMVAMLIACGYYMSTAIVGIVRRRTNWLPDNINASRLDKVYWMFAVVGAINFGYFLLCSMLYKYNNRDSREEETASDTNEFVPINSHV